VFKLIKLISALIVLLLIFLVVVGLVSKSYTSISCTEVIKSPATVVWRTLVDIEKMPDWLDKISSVQVRFNAPLGKGAILRNYISSGKPGMYYDVEITDILPEKRLTLFEVGSKNKRLLRNHKSDFELKALLDGTTEITYRVTYITGSFLTKIFNRLYLQKQIENECIQRLDKLKQVIEKV
jgi:uncharacterized membrane protein